MHSHICLCALKLAKATKTCGNVCMLFNLVVINVSSRLVFIVKMGATVTVNVLKCWYDGLYAYIQLTYILCQQLIGIRMFF